MQYGSDEFAGVRRESFAWYAAYVKHQHESKVADLLQRKGVEVLHPQQKVVRRWKDRRKTLLLPLFPSYVFLHSDLQDKVQILNTPGIFFLVESQGRACPIPAGEIDAIRRLVVSGVPAQPHACLASGEGVRIVNGPLTGVTGILTRFKNKYRVVLTVELLQKAVSIEVDLGSLERIGERPQQFAQHA